MTRFPTLVLALVAATPVAAQRPRAPAPAPRPVKPWFVDDEKFFAGFVNKLTGLAKAGKCLGHDKLAGKIKPGTKARVSPAKPGDKVLSPEEVYALALPSVFVVGSVYKDKAGDWQHGVYATAWVAAADGVLVTNWHVFEDLQPGEVFGAGDHKGNVYPVVDFLGGDKVADVAVFRIPAEGLTPLAVAEGFAPVGAWVGVLSHPGDNFYVFTTGTVTRYSTNKTDGGKRERWMGLTAEFAGGSSGSPVLDRYGAVVGMSALTLSIDDAPGAVVPPARRRQPIPARQNPPVAIAPPPREKPDPVEPAPPPHAGVQMVLKMAVPGPTILKSFAK